MGIKAGLGIEAGLGIKAGLGIEAGLGIKAGWGIEAGSGIKAGWGICAQLKISAALRIFAGLCMWRQPKPEEMEIRCSELVSGEVCFGSLVIVDEASEEEEAYAVIAGVRYTLTPSDAEAQTQEGADSTSAA